jgi:hypothetical protein
MKGSYMSAQSASPGARLSRATLVPIAESPNLGNRYDPSPFRRLNRSAVGRIFGQGEMRPSPLAAGKIAFAEFGLTISDSTR